MPSSFFSCTSSAMRSSRVLLVHLVGNFVDDDRLALALVDVLEVALGAHDDAAAACSIALANAADAMDDRGRGEVWRRDQFHQLVDRCICVFQQVLTRVDHFVQVVRRNVGGHAHGDAGRAVDQQIRQLRRQNQRLFLVAVVVLARNRRSPCPDRQASRARSWPGGSPCSASPPGCRRRPSRSCPGRRPTCGAARTAAPCARSCRRWPCRRAGGICPSRHPRSARSSCRGGSSRCSLHASRTEPGGVLASAHREHLAAPDRRSRSSRNRDTSAASLLRG